MSNSWSAAGRRPLPALRRPHRAAVRPHHSGCDRRQPPAPSLLTAPSARPLARHYQGGRLDIETILEDLRQRVKQTMIAEGDISRIASAVAKKYPDVTAEQLNASVREAAKGGKSDSEIAQALRAKYNGADFENLLAGVREATLKGAKHDQLLTAIRQEYAHISQSRAKVIAKTETNRAFLMSQFQADRPFLDQNGWTGQAYAVGLQRTGPLCSVWPSKPSPPCRSVSPSCASVTR
jgi:hypothetical protein